MIDLAVKYHNAGLSVIPIGEKKVPFGSWAENQKVRKIPEFNDTKIKGIGIVCGKISGNLESIDIDLKYDTTGTLYTEYCKAIKQLSPKLSGKLVIEQTPSGGYHFIYRCSKIGGNIKLANRETTEQERLLNSKEKTKVLIETRGEGGYIMCYPSEGYKLIYGDFQNIKEITEEERQILFDCAKLFNSVYKEPYIKKEEKQIIEANISPFEDWNNKGNVLEFLINEGWSVTLQRGSKYLLLRPNGTGKWSADWDEEKRLFYVWTSSTEFENDKAYNPSQVLTILKFRGDYSESAKWLLKNGYGNFVKPNNKVEPIINQAVSLDDDDYSFLATQDECDSYIEQKRTGTFKMGNSTGFPNFDKYFRFKDAQLDMVLGHDNVGKSLVSWYFAVLDAFFNNQNYIIFSGENKTGGVKVKLMEFYLCKSIESMNELEYKNAKQWVEKHFALVRNDESFTYTDMINIGKKMLKKGVYNKFIIEPYNVLSKQTTNEHQYDYKAMLDLRLFIRQTGIGVTLNVHAATEALRKTYPKEHDYFGYTMPPNKADAEGGGKFPNKADNFLVIHRMADHPTEWMWTEIHVQKIKEMETGGGRTFKNQPFKIKLSKGGCGFEDENGYNPMIDGRNAKPSQLLPNENFTKEYKPRFPVSNKPLNDNWDIEDEPF